MLKQIALALTLIPSLALAGPAQGTGNSCATVFGAPVVQPPETFKSAFESAGRQFRVDPDLGVAITHIESKFDAQATSPKGAQGLMQLMPGTSEGLHVTDPLNSSQNVFGGMSYLRLLANDARFRGNPRMVLVAYNAGPNRKVFPKESYAYADKVIAVYWQLKIRNGPLAPRPVDWAAYLRLPRCGQATPVTAGHLRMSGGMVVPSRHYPSK